MEKIVGIHKFGGKVDITDPCYDRDVWCRINDVEIVPGEYECYADIWDNSQTSGWGDRVARIGIRLVGSNETEFEQIGTIGVDAGMAGIFEGKPDYGDDAWSDFCDSLGFSRNEMVWTKDIGFFSNSGFGDGEYPVFAAYDKSDNVVALEICFISDYEEDEEESEEDDEEDFEEDGE